MIFSKNDTLSIKGLAILIMMFHHSFMSPDRWAYMPITFGIIPKETIEYLARFSKICVGMFVFLTGYGMMVSALNKKIESDKQMRLYVLNRYLTMMFGFWIIFLLVELITIPTGYFGKIYGTGLRALSYFFIDGLGISHLMKTPTYCPTWWYMSLAIMLIIIFPVFFRWICKESYLLCVIVMLVPIALKLQSLELIRWLLAYVLGMICAKKNILTRMKEVIIVRQNVFVRIMFFFIGIAGLLVMIQLRQNSYIGIKFLNIWDGVAPAYIIVFSYLFLLNFKVIKIVLSFLGKHSMNMFLIHTFYRGIFFPKFIYSFYYAWIDYLVLLAVSLLSSILLEAFKKLIFYQTVTEKIRVVIHKRVK